MIGANYPLVVTIPRHEQGQPEVHVAVFAMSSWHRRLQDRTVAK